MARRSRYLHYGEQMAALMEHGNPSQIPADRSCTRGSVLERLKALRAAEARKDLEKTIQEGGGNV